MIIQSSNKPIILEFTEDLTNSSIKETFRATLWNKNNEKIKEWNKDNTTIYGQFIELPLEQDETAEFNDSVELEIKWLNEDGKTEFSQREKIVVKDRNDKTTLGGVE